LFGLTQEEIIEIKALLNKNGVHKAFIFGSRAKGNFKPASDIDLAVDTNETQISYLLNEESNMAYYFDVINYNKINNKMLIEHIRRVGIPL